MDGAYLGIFHTADGLFAIDNSCPHQEGDLHQGRVSQGVVYCPLHHWRFRLCDGVSDVGSHYDLMCYRVKLEDGFVWVDVDSGTQADPDREDPFCED